MCIVEEISSSFQMLSTELPNQRNNLIRTSDSIIKRDDFFQRIDQLFESNDKKTVSIYGPGGSGKSYIALDYALEKLSKNKNLVARWVQSDTFENLYVNFVQKLLNIFFSHNLKNFLKYKNKSDIIGILGQKLKNLENEFIFVFVNLKPDKTHLKELFELISATMPQNVRILVTTRNKIDSLNCIELTHFDRAQASQLINAYLDDNKKSNIDIGTNEENVNSQFYLPLNVLKLISYVKHFNLKIGINQLEIGGGPIRRILDDLFVNFEHDKRLITYIACLDGHFIQKDLIQSITNISDSQLNESMKRLENLLLIKCGDTNEYNYGFSIHPSIYSIIRQFVEEKIENDAKKSIFSNLLEKFWGEIKIDLELDQVYDLQSPLANPD
jgi:hypothetical protein